MSNLINEETPNDDLSPLMRQKQFSPQTGAIGSGAECKRSLSNERVKQPPPRRVSKFTKVLTTFLQNNEEGDDEEDTEE